MLASFSYLVPRTACGRIPWPPKSRTRLKRSATSSVRVYSALAADSSSSSFTYRISASFSAKQHALDLVHNHYNHDARQTYLKCSSDEIAQLSPTKRWKKRYMSGQDSFFVSNTKDAALAFGVVDGVGGWTDQGVDPAEFAHRLCEYMGTEALAQHQVAATGTKNSGGSGVPRALLQMGWEQVMADDSIEAGGSTACIGLVTNTGMLHVANLGDSGYVHISPLRLTHLSQPQTHAFNTPYQLAKIPAEEAQQMELFGSAHFQELPEDADAYSHPLTHGDVFVFATDGVWDNLSPEDILRIVSNVMMRIEAWVIDRNGAVKVGTKFTDEVTGVQSGIQQQPHQQSAAVATATRGRNFDLSTVLASAIVKEAKECSLNTRRDGPFAKEVKRHFPFENWRGGKPDDICVVVGVVAQGGD